MGTDSLNDLKQSSTALMIAGILGIIVGKGMQMAGLGAVPREHEPVSAPE